MSDADSECDACVWMLGFVDDPADPVDLLRHRFPSKVGGRPAWLDPLHLPSASQLTCKATGQPLDFLLQARLGRLSLLQAHALGNGAEPRPPPTTCPSSSF